MGHLVTVGLEILAVAVCAYVAGYQRALVAQFREEQKANEQLENVCQRVRDLPADVVRQCLQHGTRQK